MKKISDFFDNLWVWSVQSSADPSKLSSTIKWALTGAGTIFTIALGFNHLSLPISQWNIVVDDAITAVQEIVMAVAAIGTVISAIRKLVLTIKKSNPVTGSFK